MHISTEIVLSAAYPLQSFSFVEVWDSLLLNCNIPKTYNGSIEWKFFEDLLNINKLVIDDRFLNNTEVYGNYSIFIESVSFSQEGDYKCVFSSGKEISNYSLRVNGL